MWTAFTGYFTCPYELTIFTFSIALTTICAKNSLSEERSFDDIEVFAALIIASSPRVSVLTLHSL
jgi:hypothetical protein